MRGLAILDAQEAEPGITGSSVTRSISASSAASWKCGRQAGAAITSPRLHSKRSPSTVVAPLPLTMA